MQLLLYPVIASTLGVEEYGLFLTIISVVNTVSAMVGSTLNNVKLIQNNMYVKAKIQGDFKLVLYCSNVISVLSLFIISSVFFKVTIVSSILCCVLSVLQTFRNYYIVTYRLSLNFGLNLIANIFVVIGYFVGLLLFKFTATWALPFIIGELFCLLYIKFTSKIMSEPTVRTRFFESTFQKYIGLGISTVTGNLLMYLDRLLLFPLLGGASVAIYTVAATLGKMFGLITTPIAGVLLGYYTKEDFKISKKLFWKINLMVIIVSVVAFILTVAVSPLFIKLFYPEFYEKVGSIIVYANLASILMALANTIQPAVLKLAPIKWQVIKEFIYGSVYILLGIVMLMRYGLLGFCFANIIANSIKILTLFILGNYFAEE